MLRRKGKGLPVIFRQPRPVFDLMNQVNSVDHPKLQCGTIRTTFIANANCGHRLRHQMKTSRSPISSRPPRGTTLISANLDQSHTCPKCCLTLPLTAFKRRSRKQGCAPSWCRECRNSHDRARRAHQRQLEAHEYLRRIRWGTLPERVEELYALAAERVGGDEAITDWLHGRLHSSSNRTSLASVNFIFKLMIASEALEIRKNPRARSTR